jgi:hypothetical protein
MSDTNDPTAIDPGKVMRRKPTRASGRITRADVMSYRAAIAAFVRAAGLPHSDGGAITDIHQRTTVFGPAVQRWRLGTRVVWSMYPSRGAPIGSVPAKTCGARPGSGITIRSMAKDGEALSGNAAADGVPEVSDVTDDAF